MSSSQWHTQAFQHSDFLLKAHILTSRLTLFVFEEITGLSAILSSKNSVSSKKWLVHLTVQLPKNCILVCSFVQIWKRHIHRLKFNETDNFYCFINGIHNWNWLFLWELVIIKDTVSISTIWCHCIILAKAPADLFALLLYL